MINHSHPKGSLFKRKSNHSIFRDSTGSVSPISGNPPKNFSSSLSRYLAIVGVYLVCLIILKVVELLALGTNAINGQN